MCKVFPPKNVAESSGTAERAEAADIEQRYRAVLDLIPEPLWVRNHRLELTWGNGAFLTATGAPTLQDAIASDAMLDPAEHEMARRALAGHRVVAKTVSHTATDGARKIYSLKMHPLPDSGVAAIAIDVSDAAAATNELRLKSDACHDLLNQIETPVAIFGSDQKMIGHNPAYARMWNFSDEWLASQPTHAEILDRLRGENKIPEQHDFAAWKRELLRPFDSGETRREQFWHLTGGKSLHVVAHPYLLGGISYLFEDISERLRLKSSLNMLMKVQRAVLNTVEDGIAIFGMDGRLKLHNDAFARMWKLNEGELSGEPHFSRIAELCAARSGEDGIWSLVSAAVNGGKPDSDWNRVTRADGHSLTFSVSRLPQGATLVNFIDLSDLEKFEALLREKSSSAA